MAMKDQHEIEAIAIPGRETAGPTVEQRRIGMRPWIEEHVVDPVHRRG
jgi:hypothetical protein